MRTENVDDLKPECTGQGMCVCARTHAHTYVRAYTYAFTEREGLAQSERVGLRVDMEKELTQLGQP